MDNQDELQEFTLEDIINEFRDPASEPVEAPEEPVIPVPTVQEAPAEPEAPAEKPEEPEQAAQDEDADLKVVPEKSAEEPAEPEAEEQPVSDDATIQFEFPQKEKSAEEPDGEKAEEENTSETIRLDELTFAATMPAREEKPAEPEKTEAVKEPTTPIIDFFSKTKIQELKKKLIIGPEKHYYDLSEIGVGRLQAAIFANMLIVALCVAATTMFALDMIPENRLRLVIFSQVLAMLVSALLGCQQMLDGIADLFRPRFTVNTLLTVTFAACCADAYFCLKELRVPCCSAFALEMSFALLARYHRRSMEMSQMDTLRKAVRLHSVVKEPDYFGGKPGILRGEGDVDDFMDVYQKTPGPEKVQSVYAFLSMILCFGIAAVAGMRHSPSLAVQVLSTSLLVAVPASFFTALTRPAALLERRLHLVGSVICGWDGVKKLCGKAAFPIRDADMFPKGATKLNGVKYYGEREPEQILAYSTSLISAADSGVEEIFRTMLANRGGTEYPVTNFIDYGNGGIGGEVLGEAVLLGSLNFMQDMGVEIPQGTMVSQAVYAAIDGQLCAVLAIAYAKMRSSSAGLVSLLGTRRLTPVVIANDFMLTEDYIHDKFGVSTRRMQFPERAVRDELAAKQPNPETQVLALTTREDLASMVYPVAGAAALRRACHWGVMIHLLGGIIGMLAMLALAYLGSVELLTPTRVLLYQLVWMLPGWLVTEWTRAV